MATNAAPGLADRTVTKEELKQVERANRSTKVPVVFVHGLWLLPRSWDRWAKLFEKSGYCALSPGWPDDPDTVEEAKAHPEVFARKSVGDIADHYDAIVTKLDRKPAIIGHSFGGLLTQILAGRGLASVSVAIDPAPFRGVLPLPISALRSSSAVLRNPANRHRAVPLTFDQFHYAFANAVGPERRRRSTTSLPYPVRANRSSRRRRRISTPGPRPRSTARTPTAAPSSSSPASLTTPCRGRLPMPPTSARSATRA